MCTPSTCLEHNIAGGRKNNFLKELQNEIAMLEKKSELCYTFFLLFFVGVVLILFRIVYILNYIWRRYTVNVLVLEPLKASGRMLWRILKY